MRSATEKNGLTSVEGHLFEGFLGAEARPSGYHSTAADGCQSKKTQFS
jgi:hypothetical protein